MPPWPCSSICRPAARAISQDCVTLASITSRKSSGFWSTIFDTLFWPDATTRMSTRPNRSTAASTIASQLASELGRLATISTLRAELSRIRAATFFELGGLAGAEHHVGAGAGQHLGGERAERAGRAGDDRGLAADVEQRERVLQEIFGHGTTRNARLSRHPEARAKRTPQDDGQSLRRRRHRHQHGARPRCRD